MKKHDTYATSDPTCPYCGHAEADWWELGGLDENGDTTEVDCGRCGREYIIQVSRTTTFTTWQPGCECEGRGWCDKCDPEDQVPIGSDEEPSASAEETAHV